MRKQIITSTQKETTTPDDHWLDLENIATVEISSEDTAHPIESALLPGGTSGWRAAEPGPQTIRLRFDVPQRLQRIGLDFVETEVERTQEYVLRWSADDGQTFKEILRQQWNFNPEGSTTEIEDLHVDLPAVTVLELVIIPNIGGGNTLANLKRLRLA